MLQEKMAESLEILKAYQDRHGDNLVIHEAGVLGRTTTGEMPWSTILPVHGQGCDDHRDGGHTTRAGMVTGALRSVAV